MTKAQNIMWNFIVVLDVSTRFPHVKKYRLLDYYKLRRLIKTDHAFEKACFYAAKGSGTRKRLGFGRFSKVEMDIMTEM